MKKRSLAIAVASLLVSNLPAAFPDWARPRPVAELNTAGDEWTPWISADGSTILFAREPSGPTSQRLADLFAASRPDRSAPFGAAIAMAELNTPDNDELMPSMTADGLEIFFFRQGATVRLMTARRDSAEEPFDPPQQVSVSFNETVDLLRYPHISPDGLALYLSDRPTAQPGSTIDVFSAIRATRQEPFSVAYQVPGLHSMQRDETSLWLSPDGLTAWTAVRPTTSSTTAVAVAHRATPGGTFDAPTVLEELSAPGFSASPCVPADGAEIFFFSNRSGGSGGLDIWRAVESEWSLWAIR